MIERAADTAIGVVHQRLGLTPKPERVDHRSEMDERAGATVEVSPAPPVIEPPKRTAPRRPRWKRAAPLPPGSPPRMAQVAAEARARIRATAPDPLADEGQADPLADAGSLTVVSSELPATALPSDDRDPLADEGQADPLAEAANAENGLSAAAPIFTGASALVTTPDPLADDDLLALPPDISNEDLVRAAEKKKVELGDAIKIRQTIGRYAPQMSMIPQERRRAFLDELEALK